VFVEIVPETLVDATATGADASAATPSMIASTARRAAARSRTRLTPAIAHTSA
jgi:hypothetical protein